MGLYTDLKKKGLLTPIQNTEEQPRTVLDRYMANNLRGPQELPQTTISARVPAVEQRFLPNLAESSKFLQPEPVKKSTPGFLLPVQGAIEGFANIPANISKSAELVAHGIANMAPAVIKGVERDYRSVPQPAPVPSITSVLASRKQAERDRVMQEAAKKADGIASIRTLPGTSSPLGNRTRKAVEQGIEGTRSVMGTPDLSTPNARLTYAVGGLLPNVLEWMSPTAAVSAPLAVAGRTGIEAEQAGASMDDQFVNAAAAGILSSALQRFGVSGEAKKLAAIAKSGAPVAKSTIVSGLKAITKAGGEEALESVVESIVGNTVAKETYDPTRQAVNPAELLEQAGTGFLLGGLAGSPRAAINAVANRAAPIANQAPVSSQQTVETNTVTNTEATGTQFDDYITGKTPIPEDLNSLLDLEEQISTTQNNAGPVDINLQQFSDTVNEKIKVNLVEQHRLAKQLNREYERTRDRSNLNPYDVEMFNKLKAGVINPDSLPGDSHWKGITETFNAWTAYKNARQVIDEHNNRRKKNLFEKAESQLPESDKWKDKKAGVWYARETMERNMLDVAGEYDGARINEEYFRPVHENEAKGQRWLNKRRGEIRTLQLTPAESQLVQALGEKLITREELAAAKGKITFKGADKTVMTLDVPEGTNVQKVVDATETFRKQYDEMIREVNDVLAQNGYEPTEYHKDYFPHFEKSDDPLVLALAKVGFDIQSMELPTDIAGLTHTFRPGKKWSGNLLHRTGEKNYNFNALEGFDRYTQGIKDVLFHTFDIQRLRALEIAMRTKYSPAEISSGIKDVIRDKSMPQDIKDSKLEEFMARDPAHLPNLVVALRAYTDDLAGKKSMIDRNVEQLIGRGVYTVTKAMQTRIARNMVALNPGSWLTNFIALQQGGSFLKSRDVLDATMATIKNIKQDDGFVNRSTFLTNRRGAERLSKTYWEGVTDTASAPMRIIDDVVAQILVRGRYKEAIDGGMTPKEAMRDADAFASGAMADRSTGSVPMLFRSKNPLVAMMTQFQLEVNNQFSFLFRDMPKYAKITGQRWLGESILRFIIGGWLFNNLYEKLTGRRPALDPLGVVMQAWDDKNNPRQLVSNLIDGTAGQLPFIGSAASNIGGQGNGGRLPIAAAIPSLKNLVGAAVDTATGDGKKALSTLGKEGAKPLAYILPPVGGGQIKKTVEGVSAFARGMSSSGDKMRYPIEQTPGNLLKLSVFGQYSTDGAREYFDSGTTPLSEAQTKAVQGSPDPLAAYKEIMDNRKKNRLQNDKLKK